MANNTADVDIFTLKVGQCFQFVQPSPFLSRVYKISSLPIGLVYFKPVVNYHARAYSTRSRLRVILLSDIGV